MADEKIAEIIKLMSLLSRDEIKEAFQTAFASPGPPISAGLVRGAVTKLTSPQVQLELFLMSDPKLEMLPFERQFQQYHTYEDGTKTWLEIIHPLKPKVDKPAPLKFDAGTLLNEVEYLTKAGPRADAFLRAVHELDTVTNKIDALMKAAEKCGIPKTKADMLLKDGNIESALKTALTRNVVKTAVRNGAWQSAALTAAFDIRRLFDGDFKSYFIKIGVSGLYGGTIGGLSSWVNHRFFGNGIVLGVLVGSAFGVVSLVSTRDWARFGKDLGISVLSGAASWGGGFAGGAIGALLGPIGAAVGAIIGSLGGGLAGSLVARKIPVLGKGTDHEMKTVCKVINQQLAPSGMELDPSQNPREVVKNIKKKGAGGLGPPFKVRMTSAMVSEVTNLRDVLVSLQEISPDGLSKSLDALRAASNRMWDK